MRRNWLITSLVVLLGVVGVVRVGVQFGWPLFSFAQSSSGADNSVVGPHAAFFDVGNNIKIVNMVKSKSSKNLNMTVMVDINATAADVSSILSAAGGLTPMVRIVGIDWKTTAGQATQIANVLNGAGLPGGTIVVFGNEVNNLDKEWKLCPGSTCPGDTRTAGAAYGNLYRAFRGAAGGGYRPVPSPVDMYNGVYTDWRGFIDSAGVYTGDLVANVYEVGADGLNSYTQYPGNVIAFTEFGPDPAKSLQEHINFFKTHTPPKPATTLIPDKCNNPPQPDKWLYYVDGKIYDTEGNEIDPATCTTGQRGLPPVGDYYKRFIYPFYSSNSTVATIKQKLQADYSVTCANPADYSTQSVGEISELIQYQISSCKNAVNRTACLFSPEAVFSLSSDGSTRLFGLMRSEYDAKWRAYDYSQEADTTKRAFTNRFESVEQWFGANNPAAKLRTSRMTEEERIAYLNRTPAGELSPLHQGPFYKLTSMYGQCLAATEVLEASSQLCSAWSELPENQGQSCQLVDRYVRGTNKKYGELRGEVLSKGGTMEGFCDRMYNDTTFIAPDDWVDTAQSLSLVDLYMETAYRPAFLVMVTEVDEENPPVNQNNQTQKITTTNRHGTSGKHIVDYLVYHVPDTITDVQEGTLGSNDDIITRTAQAFTPQEVTDQASQEWQSKRASLAGAVANPPTDPETMTIDCNGGECSGEAEPLRRALIDFINAYAVYAPGAGENLNCQALNGDQAESGTRIGSELAPNDSSEAFQDAKNGDPIDQADAEIRIDEYRDTGGGLVAQRQPAPQTRIYNIAPYGMRTKYVAEAFDALFAEAQTASEFSTSGKYLTTFEAIFGEELDSEPDIVGYQKPSDPPVIDPETGQQLVQQKDVRDEITVNGAPFSAKVPWLARVFNFSTRGVVHQISSSGEALLECARSIADPKKNTEDFLMKCQTRGVTVGNASATTGSTTIPNATCSIEGGFSIQSTEIGNLLVDAARQYNLPVQVLMAVLYTENCRNHTLYNGQSASVCDKPDAFLAPFLADHIPYPHTSGCPNQNRPDGTGVFQFNLTYWPAYQSSSSNNACSIKDSFYDAARWLSSYFSSNGAASAIGTAPPPSEWTVEDMKRVVSRWAANSDTCDGHPFARYYCSVIDELMTGSSSTSEPSITPLTAVTTTCNQ